MRFLSRKCWKIIFINWYCCCIFKGHRTPVASKLSISHNSRGATQMQVTYERASSPSANPSSRRSSGASITGSISARKNSIISAFNCTPESPSSRHRSRQRSQSPNSRFADVLLFLFVFIYTYSPVCGYNDLRTIIGIVNYIVFLFSFYGHTEYHFGIVANLLAIVQILKDQVLDVSKWSARFTIPAIARLILICIRISSRQQQLLRHHSVATWILWNRMTVE